MRTTRSSSCRGGLNQAPPQTRHPPWEQTPPLGAGTLLQGAAPSHRPGNSPDQAPPRGQTHTCKHITLPQTSFAGGNYDLHKVPGWKQ